MRPCSFEWDQKVLLLHSEKPNPTRTRSRPQIRPTKTLSWVLLAEFPGCLDPAHDGLTGIRRFSRTLQLDPVFNYPSHFKPRALALPGDFPGSVECVHARLNGIRRFCCCTLKSQIPQGPGQDPKSGQPKPCLG